MAAKAVDESLAGGGGVGELQHLQPLTLSGDACPQPCFDVVDVVDAAAQRVHWRGILINTDEQRIHRMGHGFPSSERLPLASRRGPEKCGAPPHITDLLPTIIYRLLPSAVRVAP